MARVSVIVLAFQHEAYLAECLDSVLAQRTTHDLEVLIGQDASTDDTPAICDRYAAMDPRIQVFHRTREGKWHIEGHPTGRSSCLDLLERATGQYAMILDGDDGWSDPDKLQRQVDVMEADRACMGTYHATRTVDRHGDPIGSLHATLPEAMGVEQVVGTRSPFHTSAFVYRNSAALKKMILSEQGWRAGSYDAWLFASAASLGRLGRIDGEASFYRQHGQGISASGLFVRANLHRLRILEWLMFDTLTQGRHRTHLYRVCDEHLTGLRGKPFTRSDVWLWMKAVLSNPGFFLAGQSRITKIMRAIRADRAH
ncbi:MAG: glycosyltransferase family 2 protein [Flavobacteriales bacterium]|nr:glycosyltransferase family 2 protein [Flavobacteriales bacterium]